MYALKWHRELTVEKWRAFGMTKQILMIANELNRVENAIKKADEKEAMNGIERAFELLDLTISIAPRKNMARELLRFRELLALQYVEKRKSPGEVYVLQKVLLSLCGEAYRLLANSSGKANGDKDHSHTSNGSTAWRAQ